jgi:hypothetical protein
MNRWTRTNWALLEQTQFEGVKSHSYFRLFKASMDKKEMQELEKYEGLLDE